jgi:hypothetical protein
LLCQAIKIISETNWTSSNTALSQIVWQVRQY